jgi:actin related protein 2/3 complex, subunit 5
MKYIILRFWYGCEQNNENLKQEKNLQIVMEALSAPKSSDIPAILRQLHPQQVDTLMKFIYRGMASPNLFNSALLLAWHEKVNYRSI